jgi:hypothetical protein
MLCTSWGWARKEVIENRLCPLWQQDCFFARHPEETDMQTRVLAVTAPHSDEQPAASLREEQLRRITFNGKPLTSQQQRCLESLELSLGLRLPDRAYWCDPVELWPELKSLEALAPLPVPFFS